MIYIYLFQKTSKANEKMKCGCHSNPARTDVRHNLTTNNTTFYGN